ncbi:aldehyde dehydrogenase family protein [Frankia sp. AgB1.9]|uniref:aldehyde dehydrogenase family protein n=1 Tax=unclassified Frankia TaxID=2632575 RepID=UPI001933A78D|nr:MULTISPECIES: aldehyde dehydrogenase family protein [unclassified Frankia]MBL7488829.1 aldehyde dehydrogenase family protein [Frankia sp. AgW1.1]MBL7546473.1 aldehyde dehydrogenase family protein [Frankia sp. AgB1.9]MBL7620268.1 aldehyde dehydrogenase family protein [Frankia sp. AgB1.8]
MREYLKFYIDGEWTDPAGTATFEVVNPATEEVCGTVALGSAADVDRAVAAARKAFPGWAASSREDRLALLQRILDEYQKRAGDLAAALTEEMGAPAALAGGFQVGLGAGHLTTAIELLRTFVFEEQRGATLVVREPIGVCGLITPWNWPMNQIAVKVFPALATGCTVVLKPSERSPFTGQILAEVLHAAGVPAGVFNLVQGDGPSVGVPLSAHPGVDMVSFTGSTRAGIEIARNAAPTVKRVTQELGGKGPNIILDDADFAANVAKGVGSMMGNSGQTCSAPSRMLVPGERMAEAIEAARAAAAQITVGDPKGEVVIGPVVAASQFDKIQALIKRGIDEGATLVAGGPGRPDGLTKGFYVRPTVFADVKNDMTIAREEIFGPVLTIIGYDSVEDAIEIANDTEYGLAGYVAGADLDACRAVARQIRAGWVGINDGFDFQCPFGGYKQSGNGREWGEFGFQEYLETKGILGYAGAGS